MITLSDKTIEELDALVKAAKAEQATKNQVKSLKLVKGEISRRDLILTAPDDAESLFYLQIKNHNDGGSIGSYMKPEAVRKIYDFLHQHVGAPANS